MRTRALLRVVVGLAVVQCLIWGPVGQCDAHDRGDPWYFDMHQHWARSYVRVLWEESVVDGYPGRSGSKAYFYPQREATRAQYALLLAYAFQLQELSPTQSTFRDVRKGYEAYPDKPAWGYLEAAASEGIIRGFPDRTFHPDEPIRRDHAIALLVRALDLGTFAQALSPDVVDLELRRFRDAHHVDASVRNEVALAVRYGIVEGYPDRTLQPDAQLRRSEAAVLVYRSCIYRVSVSPMMLIRDEPGLDSIKLLPFILKNRATSWFSLHISDTDGPSFWNYERRVRSGAPLSPITWTGHTDGGRELRAGMYLLGGSADDHQDNHFEAAPQPLYILDPQLSALATPSAISAGDSLALKAWTVGAPQTVVVRQLGVPSGSTSLETTSAPRTLNPQLHQRWTGTFEVPSDTQAGPLTLEFDAHFEYFGHAVHRVVQVTLTVKPALHLQASISPNPAAVGETVEFRAMTTPGADDVSVRFYGETIGLSSVDGGQTWQADQALDDVAPGTYPAVFTATWGAKRERTTIDLVVRELQLSDLLFRLAD